MLGRITNESSVRRIYNTMLISVFIEWSIYVYNHFVVINDRHPTIVNPSFEMIYTLQLDTACTILTR